MGRKRPRPDTTEELDHSGGAQNSPINVFFEVPYNDLLRRTTTAANAVRLVRTFWRADLRQVIPDVSCLTLILHARGNSVIPFDEGRKVAALIPGARFIPLVF
jgi:hypothetical protein